MRGLSDSVVRFGLDALYFSGIYHLMAPATAGRGVIFMLHRVRPAPPEGAFAPNRGLEVTPDFLDSVLARLARRSIAIVDLDEAMEGLADAQTGRFAVFTFDDGYADNLTHALPVFQAYDAPFTIYVTTGLIEGDADIWWLELEEAIARLDRVCVTVGGREFDLPARSAAEKQAAWDAIYWPLRDAAIAERRRIASALMAEAGIGRDALFATLAPRWEDLRRAARGKHLRIGAHSLTHPPLSRLSEADAHREMAESQHILEDRLGFSVRHFAYPFGDPDSVGRREYALAREIGFATAVTTERGTLFAGHAAHPHALPRVSLNGQYQATRYFDLFLSGAPFALFNRVKRLRAA
jgi:peptidoglycan/xylan/chitin deacetylase (PgdA/CDA1 family)